MLYYVVSLHHKPKAYKYNPKDYDYKGNEFYLRNKSKRKSYGSIGQK